MWDVLATNTSLLGPLGGGFQERHSWYFKCSSSSQKLPQDLWLCSSPVKANTTVSQCKLGAGEERIFIVTF